MNLSQDELCAIVGAQQIEIIMLRRELNAAQAKLKAIEDQKDDVVPIKGEGL